MNTVGSTSSDSQDLLTVSGTGGEIRRLTMLFADLVGSTSLSVQVEPETYRTIVGCYRDLVLSVVDRFAGQVGSTKGDGLLAVFGHPIAHENDVQRAVSAGLQITREVAKLSEQCQRRFGVAVDVRVGVHRGEVYVDTVADDVYGFASTVTARVGSSAEPGTVVVSDPVAMLVGDVFELQVRPAAAVAGEGDRVGQHRVLSERVASAPAERAPLIGRDRERAWLADSWAKLQTGRLAVPAVMFRGDAGVGKSRLVAEAAELAAQSGAPVLELVGPGLGAEAGERSVRGSLVHRSGVGPDCGHDEWLRPLEAELAGLAGDAQGRLIAERVATYLGASLADGPALLIAEDLHRFDSWTHDLLGSLLTQAGARLMVVITGRHRRWLRSSWPVQVFDLTALTDEEADQLIGALDPDISAAQRAQVRRRCDGVPLYIEHVVACLGPPNDDDDTGILHRDPVPDGLYQQLCAQLHVSPVVLPVVQAAAVVGRHLDRDLLRSIVDVEEHAFNRAIGELEHDGVLEAWAPAGWRFRYELVREVAAELVPASVRKELHARVADALLRCPDDAADWWLIAAHYEEAECFDSAASAYLRAESADVDRHPLNEVVDYPTAELRSA
jgi:class 3 adenylate cyclase